MRFTVGQNYTFARVTYEEKGERSFVSTYIPWLHNLTSIQVIVLKCAEHHKVAWDQDPAGEKKNDGFVFVQVDDESVRWANQYPDAAYGQLDDSNDRIVRRHFETAELLQVDANGKVINGPDGKALIADQVKWDIFSDCFWNPFELATSRIDALKRALKNENGLEDDQKKQLQEFLELYTKTVEEHSGKKVVFVPISESHPDYLVAELQ